MRIIMVAKKDQRSFYILLACGVIMLAVSVWAFRMETGMSRTASADVEDKSFHAGETQKDTKSADTQKLDTDAFARTVLEKAAFDTKLEKMDSSVAQSMISTAADDTKTELYMGEGTSADELLIVTVKDESQMELEIENVQKHLTDMQQSFQDYLPKEAKKINDAVILQSGRYIVACVSEDKDKAADVIREQLKGKQ
jgi:hypothetical protein